MLGCHEVRVVVCYIIIAKVTMHIPTSQTPAAVYDVLHTLN